MDSWEGINYWSAKNEKNKYIYLFIYFLRNGEMENVFLGRNKVWINYWRMKKMNISIYLFLK